MPDQPPLAALVTGGSRGIGRAIAVALGRAGFHVAVNYHLSREAAERVVSEVQAAGKHQAIRALAVQADISQRSDRERLVDQTVAAFGGIDLLVNNAGVAPTERVDLLEMSEESYDRVLGTNLRGTVFLTQLVAQRMLSQEPDSQRSDRCIINIGSVSAYTASVERGQYCISKAGLSMMTQLFAARLAGHGIRVYEIRPGIISTDMTHAVREKYDRLMQEQGIVPLRRWGEPEDIARLVLVLAKGELAYSTGEVINVDGGFHLRRL
jgi:NAD(P)-dependent dehydrogenase (short-subunit alcohol dehydrogenase family)